MNQPIAPGNDDLRARAVACLLAFKESFERDGIPAIIRVVEERQRAATISRKIHLRV